MKSTAESVERPMVGTELVRTWEPEGEPKAIIVLVHGIAEHSGRYERAGDLLSDAGFHVRSFDLIGHGASGGERVDCEDWNHFHDQTEEHMSWALEQGPPVVLMGHSMGGNLALGYVIEGRPPPDLLVVSAPALGGGAAWQRVAASIGAKVLPTLAIPQNIDGAALSRDPDVGDSYFVDPLVHTKATFRLGAALFQAMDDVREGADVIDTPTLVLHGGSDKIVPPQSTAALGELPGFERRLYPKLRHEILNEPEGPEIVQEIVEWINEQL
jgi:alpha-beta hydrolase superfamily lysophospholipase